MNTTFDHNYIRAKAAEVLIECNVKSFPFDCIEILKHYDYKIYTYSELKSKHEELYDMCVSYSQDAFQFGSKHLIAYNEKQSPNRIRFSLMHELGHHILEHKNDSPQNEAEANYFSSNILAPRIAMYYSRLRNADQIASAFAISSSAAYIAGYDFSKWSTEIAEQGMHEYDKNLYNQFYNASYDDFVYSIKKCEFCGATVYNELCPYCTGVCKLPDYVPPTTTADPFDPTWPITPEILHRWEYKRLYDF